jgi:hypothetical protein
MLRIVAAITFCVFCSLYSFSQGTLNGKITDLNGEPLYGVVVRSTINSAVGAVCDFDGIFTLKIPDNKTHIITFYLTGYEELRDTVLLRNGAIIDRGYTMLEKSVVVSKEVIIAAKASKAADSYMEKIKMNSPVSIDYISSETMKKTGDATVVGAIARVSGVSTNGGLITVRGIGDRYIKTTLNGSRIPTLDPLTNNIKLDIFPASLVDNIVITKTQSPDLPGDWSGAYISVETKDYPDKLTVNIESQFGYNPQVTFKDFITSERSSTDWLGFDSGVRQRTDRNIISPNLNIGTYQEMAALGLTNYFNGIGVHGWIDGNAQADSYFKLGLVQLGLLSSGQINDPVAYQNARNNYNANYRPKAIEMINPSGKDYGNGFSKSWDTRFAKAPINYTQNFSFGNQTTLFGREFGYFFGFRYGSSFRYDANGISQRVGDESLGYPFERQDNALISRQSNSWSALLNLAYKIGDNSRISFLFMPNFIGTNDVADYTSQRLPTEFQEIDVSKNIFYEQRKQLIYQGAFQHFIPKHDVKIDFNVSYTDGASVAPDFKALNYTYTVRDTQIDSYNFGPTAGEGIRRYYRYLDENILDSRLSAEFPIALKGKKDRLKIKTGIATTRNYKKIDNDEYRVALGNNSSLPPLLNGNIDQYMGGNRFVMNNGIIDFYYENLYYDRNHSFGHSNVDAGYILTNVDLTSNLRFSGGFRAEHTDIFADVDKFNRLNYERNDPRRLNVGGFPYVNPAEIKQWNVLPSGSLIYKIERSRWGRTNLRLNYSSTLARPSIRELSDAAIFDNEFRTLIYGNSDLKMVRTYNYDFRAETFLPNGDNLSVSLFHKDFRNHIELGFGSAGITWQNISRAYAQGLELEGHKVISKHFDFRANVTFVKSQERFIRQDFQVIDGIKVFSPLDTVYRPMYGQAPYLVNAIFSYKSDTLGLVATVSYNVQGPRLVIAGVVKGRPDVYEIPRHLIDFKVSKNFGKKISCSITVRDILNAPVRRSYQLPSGLVDFDRFRYGTNILFSIAYKY